MGRPCETKQHMIMHNPAGADAYPPETNIVCVYAIFG